MTLNDLLPGDGIEGGIFCLMTAVVPLPVLTEHPCFIFL